MRIFMGAAAVFVAAGASLAQEAQPATPPVAPQGQVERTTSTAMKPAPEQAPEARRVQTQVIVYGIHNFEADLDDAPGSVSIDRVGGSVGMLFPIGERSRLSVEGATEFSFYDFKNATGFGSGFSEPWDNTMQMNLAVTFSTQATRQWSWFAGAGIDDSVQTGAELSDGVTGGVFGGASYSFSEKFTIGLGAALRTHLADEGEVVPIPVINWQISDQWKLDTHAEIGARGVRLSYQPLEQLTLSLNAAYAIREYRLDDSGPAPGGVGRDYRIPVSFGAQWYFNRQFAIGARVGIDAWQEYTLLDSSGDRVSQINTKPGVFIGAGLEINF
jgi:hypothetical protein